MIPLIEIWHFLLLVDRVEDLQWLADYLNEYKEDYSQFEHILFQMAIKDCITMFI